MKTGIKQIRRREVFKSRWMTLYEDDVRFPDGLEGKYGVVEKEDFAMILPRHADGRFELVEQYRYSVGARFWEFPQGAWETEAGADPEDVARGELEEETGLLAGRLTKIGQFWEAYGFMKQGCHVYLAEELSLGQVKRDAEEQEMETGVFSRAEILAMIKDGRIMDATSIAAFGLLALVEE